MREPIFAIILTCTIFLMASCKKDEVGCYECTIQNYTTVNYPTPGYPKLETYQYETCKGDESDEYTTSASVGGITATVKTKVTCVSK